MEEKLNEDLNQPEDEQKKTEPEKAEQKKDEKPQTNPEVEKLKAALSRANGEAAEYKRLLREKQTEAERAEADRAEADRQMREELETLRRERSIGDGKTRALTLGFDEEYANAIGESTAGMTKEQKDSLFDSLKNFVETTRTKLANEALNQQPGLTPGVPPTKQTAEEEENEMLRRYAGLPPRR